MWEMLRTTAGVVLLQLLLWQQSDARPSSNQVLGKSFLLSDYETIDSVDRKRAYLQVLRNYAKNVIRGNSNEDASFLTIMGNVSMDSAGVIQSPNYPGNYEADTERMWLIGAQNTMVTLHVEDFSLQDADYCHKDWLYIYANAPSQLTDVQDIPALMFCGNSTPVIEPLPGPILVNFRTDGTGQNRGFRIAFTVTGGGGSLPSEPDCEVYTMSTGVIQSPGDLYPANYRGCWEVRSSPGQTIRITFTCFHLEGGLTSNSNDCPFDLLSATDDHGTHYGPYCGSDIPDDIVTDANKLRLTMTTDVSGEYGGFSASYQIRDGGVVIPGTTTPGSGVHPTPPALCAVMTADEEAIMTPGYPQHYENNMDICMTVMPQSGGVIHTVVLDMDLQNSFQCTHDFLDVYDGDFETGTKVGHFCAPDTTHLPDVHSGVMTLVFHSDGEVTGRGVNLKYSTSSHGGGGGGGGDGDGGQGHEACGGALVELSGEEGSFSMPSYSDLMTCHWIIRVPEGNRVKITYDSMDIEEDVICRYDGVSVSENSTITMTGEQITTVIGTSCGSRGSDVVSWGNEVMVKFYSDVSNTGEGFEARYQAIPHDYIEIAAPECGSVHQQRHHSSANRIVGGEAALPYDWPWQISMLYTGSHICGGSIYADDWIITAAHCVHGTDPADIAVVTGQHNRHDFAGPEVVIPVQEIIAHSEYDPDTTNNDIALLRLARPVVWTQYIAPVCLPAQPPVLTDSCYTTGWGDTRMSGDEYILNEVDVGLLETETCNQEGWYEGRITDAMVCAGHAAGGKDSCQGDSGGPMVCQSSEGAPWYLTGVVSWGFGCAEAQFPGIYTNTYHFLNWIEENTGIKKGST